MRKNKTKGKDVVVFALVVSNVYDRGCYHTPFQMRKTLWFDELSDPDLFFPSCPHLHSTDGQYKLNVYTGELYSTQSKKIVKGKVVKEKEDVIYSLIDIAPTRIVLTNSAGKTNIDSMIFGIFDANRV